jgi:hypothetical protein
VALGEGITSLPRRRRPVVHLQVIHRWAQMSDAMLGVIRAAQLVAGHDFARGMSWEGHPTLTSTHTDLDVQRNRPHAAEAAKISSGLRR